MQISSQIFITITQKYIYLHKNKKKEERKKKWGKKKRQRPTRGLAQSSSCSKGGEVEEDSPSGWMPGSSVPDAVSTGSETASTFAFTSASTCASSSGEQLSWGSSDCGSGGPVPSSSSSSFPCMVCSFSLSSVRSFCRARHSFSSRSTLPCWAL